MVIRARWRPRTALRIHYNITNIASPHLECTSARSVCIVVHSGEVAQRGHVKGLRVMHMAHQRRDPWPLSRHAPPSPPLICAQMVRRCDAARPRRLETAMIPRRAS